MDRSLVCLISGKKFVFNKEYFAQKVEEYGDVDSLKKYFITKKVKSLLLRGYDAQEIRNILEVDATGLPTPDSDAIKGVINYHRLKSQPNNRRTNSSIFNNNTDPDVAVFINNIKASL